MSDEEELEVCDNCGTEDAFVYECDNCSVSICSECDQDSLCSDCFDAMEDDEE